LRALLEPAGRATTKALHPTLKAILPFLWGLHVPEARII